MSIWADHKIFGGKHVPTAVCALCGCVVASALKSKHEEFHERTR